ncbi:MAG: ABC transporter permease subunit [Anaerolineae bacterium]|nr:ABC transporter permease subunit [Anaerolineae bacterium]
MPILDFEIGNPHKYANNGSIENRQSKIQNRAKPHPPQGVARPYAHAARTHHFGDLSRHRQRHGVVLYIGAAISAPRANSNNGSIGISLFSVLVGMQVVLVCFIAPALTVSAISSERERMTYDSLRATPLGARQIALGKLLSALGYVSLAVLATLPLFSIVFLLGGIELVQVLMALSVVLASAFLFTALGLFVSSRMRSTVGATI